jgi:collagen type VII alpha
MAINSYSSYLRSIQNPTCVISGPTGLSGNTGPTGTRGPTGPAGRDGLSTGLIYYFRTEQAGQPNNQPVVGNVGPTGFSMNPIQLSNGPALYSSIVGPISNTGTTLADFRLPFTSSTPMPSGNWVFTQNLYSFNTSVTGTIPTTISPYINQISSGGTATSLGGSSSIYFDVNATANQNGDENGYTVTVPVKNTTFNIGDNLQVVFKTNSGLITNQEVQFWTEGDSISQVVTTFSPQSGPTGAQGPTGTPGTNGINGVTGPTGPQGGVPIGTPNQVLFFGPSGSATGSSNFTIDSGSSFLNANQVNAAGLVVSGTTYLQGNTLTQTVSSTSLSVNTTINAGGNITANTFIQPVFFSNALNFGDTLTTTAHAGRFNINPQLSGNSIQYQFDISNPAWNTATGCILFIQQVDNDPNATTFNSYQNWTIISINSNTFRISKTVFNFLNLSTLGIAWYVIRSS